MHCIKYLKFVVFSSSPPPPSLITFSNSFRCDLFERRDFVVNVFVDDDDDEEFNRFNSANDNFRFERLPLFVSLINVSPPPPLTVVVVAGLLLN
ncbi:hypothetical protein DERP_003928 [Dermatophagoides pteronyssinus]|uniref:Transmembrane protein n=1 Tax=Dermatophagoides pteronyssinus TaxID=6956 RepID=A0ABQ8J7Q5_DERPT|nr:hypothetical protein DERP_003928 [Dermatophagoides pteronyssinus]